MCESKYKCYSYSNYANAKKELFIPKETNNENKELKKVEKKVIFNLNNINKSTPKIKLKEKKNNNNNINTSNENKKIIEKIANNTQNINTNKMILQKIIY